ncbi:Pre-mRNA-splicing factor cef1 [Coemansia interrupta]|uniref:Pre-mRNA-splicing factor cef1 n=1 Tax=Coemansia interrupta TaxID=1126814 RepID=A0A9W8HLC3_9FUNG|nr:Pre-mRNA-splicing factor cef1 [Coemansia interrupta]
MRVHLKGGVWKNTEDEILKAAVMKYGKTQWSRISSLLVRKTPKQCKARWYEWLDPSIKKTEWSREEDEKLLHLARLMPTQWRTIAPIVGRSPAQCLERYQRLLDEAEARAAGEDDLGLRGETGAEGRAADARRLRPGEIDPNPETKAARPDPVDMDEDEKDMLSEARARLANTMGKKAKRKARERQLEEARRLASLQKRRELKAAGVELKTKKPKKGVKFHSDYNAEIPFERKPMPGFYDTTEELARSDRGNHVDSVKGRFLDTLEGKGRLQREEDARAEAKRKRDNRESIKFVRQVDQKGMEAIAAREEADQLAKRKKLVLPAPQVGDQELELIAKMGQQSSMAQEMVGGEGADELLGDYSATPSAASMAVRTPAQSDRIMNEALAQRAQAMQATPLLGAKMGEGAEHDDTAGPTRGSRLELTARRDINDSLATPNPLAAVLAPGSGTSVRDELGLNTPAPNAIASSTPRERKMAERSLREQLARKLASLPKPKNEFEIVVPEETPTLDTAVAIDAGTSATIEDQADVERRMEQLRVQEMEDELRRRSQCVQRGLPRPTRLGSSDIAAANDEQVAALIGDEMRRMILHDARKHPVADMPVLRPPSGMRVEALDDITEERISKARELILAEAGSSNTLQQDIAERAWRDAEASETWVGPELRFVPTSSVTAEQYIAKYRMELDARRELMAQEAGKAAKSEKKLGVVLGGYQARAKMLSEKIAQAYKDFEQTRLDTHAFATLYASEQAIIPSRIEKAKDELRMAENLERSLQAEYQELCKCHSQKKILVCYDNCPDSENRTLQEMQVQIFCAAVNGKEYNSELIDRMTRPARIVADDPQPTRAAPEQQQQQPPPPPPPNKAPDADRDDDGVFGGRASARKGAGGGHGSNFSLVDDNAAGALGPVAGARSAMAAALIAAYIIGSAM